MKNNSRNILFPLVIAILFLSGAAVFAQDKNDKQYKKRDFCSGNNYSYNNKVSYKETREMTISAGNLLNVNGMRNGGIQIKGENRSDVLIRACVQTTGENEQEAQTIAKNIRIETSPNVRAENAPDDSGWSASYEILVPRSTNLKLAALNGGISISGVEGTMEFYTQNGGIHLSEIAGDVKGRTTNGGVHVTLSGNGWKGNGLDLQTTNGGVHLRNIRKLRGANRNRNGQRRIQKRHRRAQRRTNRTDARRASQHRIERRRRADSPDYD